MQHWFKSGLYGVYAISRRFLLSGLVIMVALSLMDAQTVHAGWASYYHDSLEGNKTASGEIFDQSKFTAAHKTLRFGTWVLVRDLTGDEVVVYINDRLPAHSTRMIDLTTQAAKRLDLIEKGIERVNLQVISTQEAWLWFMRNGFGQLLIAYM
ncbi:septal ring lytic transglycosylase RlpA family protein [Membranicola marinus]|uniref:Probable endolytic peptidoglycan transglycosylase RlpA n=1 Tax=Membranihabitans marinus TaxID=1227546 RepID=A0A953LBT0_9BACT|nr:septal ring lytic transglycosylase RlpA family protein [Membranihabitans marinus]MBY5960088.1 septal ring lytic transglycosylase RlpA family protein [Membranihabitans marinus]